MMEVDLNPLAGGTNRFDWQARGCLARPGGVKNETIWAQGFEALGVDPKEIVPVETKEGPSKTHCGVLITEQQMTTKSDREAKTQLFFEHFEVQNYYLSNDQTLAMYGTGRTTGLALNLGYGSTRGVAVYEGYTLPHTCAIQRSWGGKDLTNSIATALGLLSPGTDEDLFDRKLRAFAEGVKHRYGRVNAEAGGPPPPEATTSLKMPDGSIIQLGSAVFDATERLFGEVEEDRAANGMYVPMQRFVDNLIHSVDLDLNRDMRQNILLHGGTSLIPGLGERLKNEIKAIVRQGARGDIKVIQAGENPVWAGGSILGSLSTFDSMWITPAEYEENGPGIVHRKCF